MSTVWIVQCLCPRRHAILAGANMAEDKAEAQDVLLTPFRDQVASLLLDRTIDPWCLLCKAPTETWFYEIKRTRFRSMEEAMPELRQMEDENAIARLLLGNQP